MDHISIINFILASGLVLFAVYFLINKLKLIHKRLIAVFLLTEAIYLVFTEVIDLQGLQLGNIIKSLEHCAEAFVFLLSPLLYMLTKSVLNPRYKVKLKHAWHALPFIFLIALPFVYHFIANKMEKEIIYIQDLYSILFLVQFPIYIISALSYIKYYGKMRHTHRKIKHDDRVKWMQVILVTFFVTWIFNTAYNTFSTVSGISTLYLHVAYLGINIAAFGLIVYLGLHFGNIFSISPVSRKFHYAYLSEKDKRRYLEDLYVYVQVNKPYVAENITLESASGYLNIRPHLLSQILEEKLNQTFDDYLNSVNHNGKIKEFNN